MGYPVFPAIPDAPGVPAIPRFPSLAPQLSSVTGSIAGTLLNVVEMTGAPLIAGAALSASGLFTGTSIVSQLTGGIGGIGTYAVNQAQSFSGSMSSVFTPPDVQEPEFEDSDADNVTQDDEPQWGIFKDGKAVVLADNVVSVDFKQDWQISDYQVQQGAFESYDKVYVPYDARVRFSCGGPVSRRAQFLQSIDTIAKTLDKYDVVTPEKVITSVNVVHQGYQRAANDGAGLIKVDVWLEQVSETASATFSTNTTSTSTPKTATSPGTTPIKTPAAAYAKDAINGGTVQASSAAFLNLGQLSAPIPKFQ